MNEEIINVSLYGGKSIFGGKEEPLVAKIIYCDKCEVCSYFKNGQCLNVSSFLRGSCKFGYVRNIEGYTSRAKKYREFKNKWEQHDKYNKLVRPPTKLGLIDDMVVFPYPYIRIRTTEDGQLIIEDPSLFDNGISFIEYDKFTPDFIYRICTFRPQAIFGGEIKDYQEEIVPLFLSHLKEVMPDRYNEFISKYGGFEEKINYIGRKALLKTIKPSFVYYKSERYPELNSEWYWDGEFLDYVKGYVSKFNITDNYEILGIKLKPSEQSVVTITSNEQVKQDTVFVD